MTSDEIWAAREAERRASEHRLLRRILMWTLPLLVIVAVVLPIGPLWRLMHAPSSSMAPTIETGDHFAVSHLSYGIGRQSFDWFEMPIGGRWFGASEPRHGDIVVFRLPKDRRLLYVKRVIGVGGDTVQMIAGVPHINGKAVGRVAAAPTELTDASGTSRSIVTFIETLPNGVTHRVLDEQPASRLDATQPVVVPPGHLFVLGDHRDNSVDSRMPDVGLVPADHVVGKVIAAF